MLGSIIKKNASLSQLDPQELDKITQNAGRQEQPNEELFGENSKEATEVSESRLEEPMKEVAFLLTQSHLLVFWASAQLAAEPGEDARGGTMARGPGVGLLFLRKLNMVFVSFCDFFWFK